MGNVGGLGRIVRICSHPQSLAQCRGWLQEHLSSVELVPASSNGEAARRARDERGTAAIAGETAAEVYGLKVLAAEIEDRADNTTRFLVLGRKLLAASGQDRTTLLVSVSHTDSPGALHRLLEPLARHRVSMTRIRVAPPRIDVQMGLRLLHRHRGSCRGAALGPCSSEALKRRSSLFRVLGSYPRAVL